MNELTAIQQQVYDFTCEVLAQGLPFPSLREIATQFGFKHTTARFHLKALERKGYIKQREQRVSEYFLPDHLLQNTEEFLLVAKISAGSPMPVYDETSESFSVNHEFFGGGDIRGIRVSGDSMSGDSIADGDIAMIKFQNNTNKGDILALRIDDEITLKRINLVGDTAQLLPSNPDYPVREVAAQSLQVIGKLVGVIRKT
ncbi:MAG: repressor LexA [Gammaproteobacteria bacterium]|nr:repressor LexA [Gammaproteobacteria bacterium]